MPSLSDLLNNKEKEVKKVQVNEMPVPFYISMTTIKYLIDSEHQIKAYCPLQLYAMLHEKIPNNKDSFQKGKLLETLVLGSSAKGDSVTSLGVNKKSGGMLKDEADIRMYAQLCKIKMAKHQIAVHEGVNTQVPVVCRVNKYPDILLRTELDLFPTTFVANPDKSSEGLKLAAIDLKSTPDIDKGYGAYNWGKPEYLDHIQPDSIFYILDNLDIDLCKSENPEYEKNVGYDNVFTPFVLEHLKNTRFYYMVVGYKMDYDLKNIRFFERLKKDPNVKSPDFRQKEFEQRMYRAIERIEWHYRNGWEAIPYHNKYEFTGCKYCNINKENNSLEYNENKGYCTEADNIQAL